ncbi:uncharacterized protein F4822DRAFT_217909 [Hypoxylon trugodes]|uniref:uncharacterized protein n=1 Tax=Hypoxylon trugodes TaxID=326681 RepID=UPI00218FA2FB|nr:uncharacterized protein F4822DRAFT_217909 [Hypoxylon trugodes]KAI1389906.1 hypothetical protein F4822DRAFT_217909 [Hypoxylon trugodes]
MNRLPETNSGTVTSWIPIPTTHPHQPGCESSLWKFVPNTIAAWDPGYGISVSTSPTCLPKPVTTWWLQDRFGPIAETVLSIGPVTCPQDYYTATASAKDSSSTLIACCPMEYDFVAFSDPGSTGECTSKLKKGDIVTFATKDSGWHVTTSTVTAASNVAAIPVNGWVFASSTNSANNCEASVTSALANQMATGNASCEATSGGISSGAAAGIGVGVSMGVTGLAALGAGLFMMYRTRKVARRKPAETHIAHFVNSGGKGMNTSAQALPTYTSELRDTPSPPERPQYQPIERDMWDATAPCLPSSHSRTPSNALSNAITVPHGEMDATSYQGISERSRMGTPYQDIDGRTLGARTVTPSHQDSEEEMRRRMELEGEFDRNVKVNLTSPWVTTARPPFPSSTSSSQHYHPPY